MAVDTRGNVYVSDTFNDRVQRWTPGSSAGVTVAGGNGNGSNANQLSCPDAVSIDFRGNVYVADTENHRVQQLSAR